MNDLPDPSATPTRFGVHVPRVIDVGRRGTLDKAKRTGKARPTSIGLSASGAKMALWLERFRMRRTASSKPNKLLKSTLSACSVAKGQRS